MGQAVAAMALAMGLLGSSVAHAYDIVGVGAWSCVAWTDARKNRRSDTTEQWALGFLSGIGFVGPHGANPLRGLPPQAVTDWLDSYCHSNPKDTIVHAAEVFSATREVFSGSSTMDTDQAPAASH
jgi:hypothetical protein